MAAIEAVSGGLEFRDMDDEDRDQSLPGSVAETKAATGGVDRSDGRRVGRGGTAYAGDRGQSDGRIGTGRTEGENRPGAGAVIKRAPNGIGLARVRRVGV